jgi:hypothetical protein
MGVYIFYGLFTLVYGLMNWVVYRSAAAALPLAGGWLWGARVLFLLMILSPAVTGLLHLRSGLAAYVVYIWLGLIFYLFLGSVVLAPLRFLGLAGWHRILFISLVFISVGLCIYGFFHARRITVHEVGLTTDKLPAGETIRAAIISDVHLYSVETTARLDRVLAALKPLKFDIFISCGDLIEAGLHEIDWRGMAGRFGEIHAPLGKFGVMGNHEVYANIAAGFDIAREFHEKAGLDLLVDQARRIGPAVTFIGLADQGHGRGRTDKESALLQNAEKDRFIILLKHQPAVVEASIGGFDLMISGHTHNGQIWPFNHVVKLFYPFVVGQHDLGGGQLYVSPGTGSWGPPIRVGSTAEITLLVVTGSSKKVK